MSRYRPNQLVRIKHLQPYSYTLEGAYIRSDMARNSGKLVLIDTVYEYNNRVTYCIRNPRSKRVYSYAYPESALIGITIYKRPH